MYRRILARRIGKQTRSDFIDIGEIVYDADRRVLGVGDGQAEPARMISEQSDQEIKNKTINGKENNIENVPPLGTVIIYPTNSSALNFLGNKWTEADGKLLDRSVYSELFNVIDTTFSAGDGSTTFGVPNFQPISSNLSYFIKIKP